MASELTEEAISEFVSFTSASREQAISFLKAHYLNLHKAINAYFEDPTGPQAETHSYQNDQNLPSFQIEHLDPVPGISSATPPSRPPSMLNLNDQSYATEYQGVKAAPTQSTTADTDTGISLADQEERELQRAVAMSLSQNLGHQETGVTGVTQSSFNKATRDNYDEGAWAMTLFNSSAQEIIISPDPGDRKRVNDEPAFLRPSQDNLYLGGLLTILHSIPLAREALLFRHKLLSDYGHDSQWWNGQPINLPKIVTIQDANRGDADWDDIIYELQRLVAFLDSTTRAFGSADALSGLKSMSSYDSEGDIGKFLEMWQESAIRADPGNQLATIFTSSAYKRPLTVYDTPIHKEFFTLDPFVEPDPGQTLYDVLDRTMWSDRPGEEELDDVWLEHVAEVLIIKLENSDPTKPVDVKVPAVFYPDRYLADNREFSRDFRMQRLRVYEEIFKLESLANRFEVSRSVVHRGLTSRQTLEKAAAAASLTLPKSLANGASELSLTPEAANAEAQRLANELRAISSKIDGKLKELELRKQRAMETLRSYSKILTEPSASPNEAPHHKYTLRGVCTEPHITYVLRPRVPGNREKGTDPELTPDDEWQWWRISFSTDDAKIRGAESNHGDNAASKTADVIGYTARKVREIEVLRAARGESKNILLVYANSNAMSMQEDPIPPPLQEFVNLDNQAFELEFQATEGSQHLDEDQNQEPATSGSAAHQSVNVFDYEVQSFDEEMGPGQEMQEKNTTAGPVQSS